MDLVQLCVRHVGHYTVNLTAESEPTFGRYLVRDNQGKSFYE